jgi:hypothetical protein
MNNFRDGGCIDPGTTKSPGGAVRSEAKHRLGIAFASLPNTSEKFRAASNPACEVRESTLHLLTEAQFARLRSLYMIRVTYAIEIEGTRMKECQSLGSHGQSIGRLMLSERGPPRRMEICIANMSSIRAFGSGVHLS